jgi:hypothetical protein
VRWLPCGNLGEHVKQNEETREVAGSIPVTSTNFSLLSLLS